jgi:hypothetical protein
MVPGTTPPVRPTRRVQDGVDLPNKFAPRWNFLAACTAPKSVTDITGVWLKLA